jgi:hypothetical protein
VGVITFDSNQNALVAGEVRGATYLMDFEFASGTQYFSTFTTPIPANGHTYTAIGSLVSISPLRESETLSMEKMTFSLSIVDTAMLGYVIGDASEYRNRAVRLYLQLLGSGWEPLYTPVLRWSGVMDTVKVNRKANKDGNSLGNIELVCQRSGLARFRKGIGLRMSHEQQQLDYPGDMGLEYTEQIVANPPPWLTKKFQEV